MPLTIGHSLTATTPDNTSYEIRPSHWNQPHLVTLSAAGSEIVGAFSNANGVSFGLNSAGQVTGSVAPSGLNISAGIASALLAGLVFSNANAVSFGLNGSTITASIAQPVTSNLLSGINVSAPNSSQALSGVSFGNNTLVSFGLSNGVITASVAQTSATFSNAYNVSFTTNGGTIIASASYSQPTQTSVTYSNSNNVSLGVAAGVVTASASFSQSNQTNFQQAVSISGNTSGALALISSGTLFLQGGNNVTISQNGNTLVLSGPNAGGAQTGISGIVAGGSTVSAGTVVFSNANGVSFGFNGSTITASVAPTGGAQTGISGVVVSNTTFTSGTINFVNANGISFGGSGANGISASIAFPAQTADTAQIYLGGNTFGTSASSYDVRSLSMVGSGEISLGWSASSLIISTPVGNFDSMGVSNIGNTAGQTGVVSQSYIFAGTNNITLNQSTGAGGVATLYISGPNLTQQTGISGVQFSNTTFTSGTINFVNGNGFSFLAAGVGSISASYTVPSVAGLISAINVSAGTTSSNQTALSFGNANSVSFGYSNGSITASIIPNLTQSAVSGIAAGGATLTSGTINFSNANGISFGSSGAGAITASYTVPSVAGLISAINVSAGTTQSNYSNIAFFNGNGVTFGLSNGTITASVAAVGGAQTGISGFAVSNTTFTSGTLSFVNANGISFGSYGANQISASYTVPTFVQSTQPVAASGSNGSFAFSTLNFGNSNGISFYTSNGSILASYTTPAGGGIAAAAGTQTGGTGTIVFSNANGVTFGMSGSSAITASFSTAAQTVQPVAISGSNGSFSFNTVSFGNLNGVSFYTTAGSVVASYSQSTITTNGLLSAINISGGTTSTNASGIVFSNANAFSFGLVGNTLTGSFSQSIQTQGQDYVSISGNTAGAAQQISSGTMILAGGNNITISQTGYSLYFSGPNLPAAQTGISGIAVAGTNFTSGTVTFSNSNNVSFSSGGAGIIVASASFPAQTAQSLGLYAAGNTTLGSSQTVDARTLSFAASGALAVAVSNGSVLFSNNFSQSNQAIGVYGYGNQTGTTSSTYDARLLNIVGQGNIFVGNSGGSVIVGYTRTANTIGISNIGNTLGTSGYTATNQIIFVGSNNITLSGSYSSNSATIAIFGGAGVAMQDSATTLTSGTLYHSNANNVSFGITSGSILTASASYPAQTAQPVAISGSNGSFAFSTVTFGNANGVSFYTSNGSIVGSVSNDLNPVIAAGTQTQVPASSGGTVIFSNANNVSFGMANSSVITASFSQSLQTFGFTASSNTVSGSSGTFSALNFVGLGNVSVGFSNSSILISGSGGGGGAAISAGTNSQNTGTVVFSNSNNVSFGLNAGTLTASVASQSNQSIGAYLYGNSTINSSGTFDARSLNLSGSGALTFGVSSNSLIMSVPSLSSISATGGLSLSINGTVLSLGVATGISNSFWSPMVQGYVLTTAAPLGNGSVYFFPAPTDEFVNVSQMAHFASISLSTSSNSSMAGAISLYGAIFTRNGSTMSLLASGSAAIAFSNTSNNSYGSIAGLRVLTAPVSAALSPGDYWVAFMSRSNTTNANWFTANNVVATGLTIPFAGSIGQSSNASLQMIPGLGVFSASSNVIPSSVAFSQLNGQGSTTLPVPYVTFNNFTV